MISIEDRLIELQRRIEALEYARQLESGHLVAAAPRLLAACRKLVAFVADPDGTCPLCARWGTHANACPVPAAQAAIEAAHVMAEEARGG